MNVPQVRLTGRASRFVFMLRDFGHLDDEGVDRLLLGAADLRGPGAVGPLDLPEVRRAAAMLLFTELDGAPPPALLQADWPILFS